MREAIWTACVAAAYALGFLSALLCLELSHEWVLQRGEAGAAAGLYGRPLRALARQVTLRSLFTNGSEIASSAFGPISANATDSAGANGTASAGGASGIAERAATALQLSVDAENAAEGIDGEEDDGRERVNIYIGIFTTGGGDYSARRRAIRETWLRGVRAFDDLRAHFVVGKARGLTAQRAMAQEKAEYQDFLELDMTDCYSCLTEKTVQFFLAATARYNANYVLKIDDDVYLNPQRLRLAARQWAAMPAEYIGCFHKGPVLGQKDDRDSKWFEPAGDLLGKEYHLNAFGSAYVVSGLVADKVVAPNAARLRRLANEDTSMGLWMLAFDVTFFDDTRLCSRACDRAGVAFWHIPCTGMCHPVEDTRAHHANRNCSGAAQEPLPYLDSWDMNRHFHRLRRGVP